MNGKRGLRKSEKEKEEEVRFRPSLLCKEKEEKKLHGQEVCSDKNQAIRPTLVGRLIPLFFLFISSASSSFHLAFAFAFFLLFSFLYVERRNQWTTGTETEQLNRKENWNGKDDLGHVRMSKDVV